MTVFFRTARRLAASALLLFLGSIVAPAQTVRPVIDEIVGNRVKVRIEYMNDGLLPLYVVLEPRSFTLGGGNTP